jgi:hypothetical protein
VFRRDHHVEGLTGHVDRLMTAVLVPDDTDRLARLHDFLSSDFVYVSPEGVFDGADGLSEAFASYRHDAWKQTMLHRTSPVEIHHGYFRFTWRRVESGATAMEGWALGSLDEKGAIDRVVVFEGMQPARSGASD